MGRVPFVEHVGINLDFVVAWIVLWLSKWNTSTKFSIISLREISHLSCGYCTLLVVCFDNHLLAISTVGKAALGLADLWAIWIHLVVPHICGYYFSKLTTFTRIEGAGTTNHFNLFVLVLTMLWTILAITFVIVLLATKQCTRLWGLNMTVKWAMVFFHTYFSLCLEALPTVKNSKVFWIVRCTWLVWSHGWNWPKGNVHWNHSIYWGSQSNHLCKCE